MDLASLLEKLTRDVGSVLKVDLCDVRTLEGEDLQNLAFSNIDGVRDRATRSRRPIRIAQPHEHCGISLHVVIAAVYAVKFLV
ncbi:MAG: hypothetical protein ACREQW_16370 [Candidatus Binatia bacterium]